MDVGKPQLHRFETRDSIEVAKPRYGNPPGNEQDAIDENPIGATLMWADSEVTTPSGFQCKF